MPEYPKQIVGTTGGFHYGSTFAPCNGVLHATDREHSDGRQIFVCDACGSECLKNWQTVNAELEAESERLAEQCEDCGHRFCSDCIRVSQHLQCCTCKGWYTLEGSDG